MSHVGCLIYIIITDNARYHIMKLSKYIVFLAVILITISSCVDDDFSSSPDYNLQFSTDTVKFDTVFSKVPSSTRTMWVHNKSEKDLRCSNIRLLNGNQTGYRVNVDGVYLSPASGFQVQNVEIRKNDSIRVFVELTPPRNGTLEAKRLQDKLVFRLESGNVEEIILDAFSWDAKELNHLVVTKDTTIESESPILVNGTIKVQEGATMTIPAGQTLYFSSNSGIEVDGKLVLSGTKDKNVTLRGSRLDNMFDYLPYDLVSGQWNGIRFTGSSYDNKIEFADIHSAMNGIVCDSSDVYKRKLNIENSIIHNCQGYGVEAINSDLYINNSQITNTLKDCLAIFGGKVFVGNSTIAQFYPFDSKRGAALRFSNSFNGTSLLLLSMQCVNDIITGYSEDVMFGEPDDSENPFNYMFKSCLIRTPEVTDEKNKNFFTDVIWEEPSDTVSGGEKNFKLVDIEKQYYDFHLSGNSKAIGTASVEHSTKTDRDGAERDEKPDMGCYEFKEH